MAVRDDRSDVKQTTTGFRGPLMVQSLTSAKSKFLSLRQSENLVILEFDCIEKWPLPKNHQVSEAPPEYGLQLSQE